MAGRLRWGFLGWEEVEGEGGRWGGEGYWSFGLCGRGECVPASQERLRAGGGGEKKLHWDAVETQNAQPSAPGKPLPINRSALLVTCSRRTTCRLLRRLPPPDPWPFDVFLLPGACPVGKPEGTVAVRTGRD